MPVPECLVRGKRGWFPPVILLEEVNKHSSGTAVQKRNQAEFAERGGGTPWEELFGAGPTDGRQGWDELAADSAAACTADLTTHVTVV